MDVNHVNAVKHSDLIAYEAKIDNIYEAAFNGSRLLNDGARRSLFYEMTQWIMRHFALEDWQREIVRKIHASWMPDQG